MMLQSMLKDSSSSQNSNKLLDIAVRPAAEGVQQQMFIFKV